MAGPTFDLVVAANRLPAACVVDADGTRRWQRSPGGLVSAIEPVMRARDGAWVGGAGEPGPSPAPFREGRLYLHPVGLSTSEVERYYEGFSNATLWPLFHHVGARAEFHRAWWGTYREINDRFARAVVEVAAPEATVWVHDYHLLLVPQMVRALRPDLRIGWFNHIPFPPVELFAQLPWRRSILQGLLGADFLGFQRTADADNFLRVCGRLLGHTTRDDTVTVTSPLGTSAPRTVRVGAVPISVDFRGLDSQARSRRVVDGAAAFRASLGDPQVLILGVDRLDYTKGIRHRLKAYEELLRDGVVRPPEVTFVEAGLPSRQRIDAYRVLGEEVESIVGPINDEHSPAGSSAIHFLRHRYPRPEMLAMFLAADVMLVTPLRDGMNLVAKEYVACRHDLGGALVLSEFAGAWHELRHEAFACNPHDIDGMKQAIMSAITAPTEERRRRMEALRGRVAGHDVQRWATEFLQALACAPAPRA